jgi:hypothetical protein
MHVMQYHMVPGSDLIIFARWSGNTWILLYSTNMRFLLNTGRGGRADIVSALKVHLGFTVSLCVIHVLPQLRDFAPRAPP